MYWPYEHHVPSLCLSHWAQTLNNKTVISYLQNCPLICNSQRTPLITVCNDTKKKGYGNLNGNLGLIFYFSNIKFCHNLMTILQKKTKTTAFCFYSAKAFVKSKILLVSWEQCIMGAKMTATQNSVADSKKIYFPLEVNGGKKQIYSSSTSIYFFCTFC